MARTKRNFVIGATVFAAFLAFAPMVHAEADDSCTKNFSNAAAVGADLKAASLLLDKAGSCCATTTDTSAVQSLIGSIKAIVSNTTAAVNKGAGLDDAGKVLTAAFSCAGQPGIVAQDPTLYSTVLADSARFAELARDENDCDPVTNKNSEGKDCSGPPGSDVNETVQFARRAGSLPNNNQQPTVSIEQK